MRYDLMKDRKVLHHVLAVTHLWSIASSLQEMLTSFAEFKLEFAALNIYIANSGPNMKVISLMALEKSAWKLYSIADYLLLFNTLLVGYYGTASIQWDWM